ncbi:MAG: CZB domain-containing protein [Sulfurovaceae bacterium]|nr:CZB domain-containing protein [Sulfurovaceae bacterium]
MDKLDVLRNIRAARRAHVLWVQRAKSLVNGLPVTKEQIPLEVTTCEFGQWFYCDGQILLSIFTEDAVKKVEEKHKSLHDIYMRIFKIYFSTASQSFFEKLLKYKKEVSETERDIALKELERLEIVSSELISYLNIIEKKLNTIDEETFSKFI